MSIFGFGEKISKMAAGGRLLRRQIVDLRRKQGSIPKYSPNGKNTGVELFNVNDLYRINLSLT